jgi:beta-lactamase regulating signal transducer with metallopeptidase domain
MSIHVSPELVRMIGWALLHFVWQGGVVAVLLSVVFAMSRRASVRYAAAVFALLLMLLLPIATVVYLDRPVAQEPTSQYAADTMPVSTPRSVMPGHVPHHSADAQEATAPAQPEAMLWLVRLWLVGVVLFSLRSAGGFVLAQRLRKIATSPATGELLRMCRAVQQRMGIGRVVRYCRSAALQVPAVVGGFRPMVLLPITALTGLSDAQIEAIVAHELAHIRRLDYFVNLFQVFAETVLFYHPAVWWVNNKIRAERENCCDDTAIAVCGNRVDYVRALTHLERMRIAPQFAMAANGSPLKARVRRILGMAEEREDVRSGSSLMGVMLVAGLILAGTSFVNGAKAQNTTTPSTETTPAWATPAAPAAAEPSTEATPTDQAVPATPATAATPAIASEPPSEPVKPEVSEEGIVGPIEMHTPIVRISPRLAEVHVPAVHVAVPAVNVASPAVIVNNHLVHVVVPPINVHVPAMNLNMPAMHIGPVLAQAATGSTASAAPSESYIDGMKSAGMGDLTVDELVAMKVQGITPQYVRDMRATGIKIDADDLVGMKVQGVTPEYVKEMRAAYPGIDTDEIIGFKVQGITPVYVAEFTKLGVKADADEIMGLRVQGVTAKYIQDMRATGINFDTDELIGMKVQGVTPQYVETLKSAGLGKLDADDIIGAKAMGITPEFVEKAKSHGFKDLDLDKLIQLKNANIM